MEFTTSTTKTDKFGEAVCAFANDLPNRREPGYLVVGVDDHGTVSGLTVNDELLRNLGALCSNVNLEPLPGMAVQKFTLPEGDVAVVEVRPSKLPPVRYKGRVWVRVGPTRHGANREEEGILVEKRVASQQTFDLRPCSGCTLADLTTDMFRTSYLPAAVEASVIEENDRTYEEQMASLRFYDLAADCPTNAGVLLFGRDPLRCIPGAWIQFVCWPGTTMAEDPITEKKFSGDLITVLRAIVEFASIPARPHPVAQSVLRERTEFDYPTVAIRELLLNAIMHRSYESNAPVRYYWYADRIEIQSPGGLYGMASPENFPQQTDYRNPALSASLATLGYVNRFGRGVIRAQDALRTNGNPEARFRFETTHVLATIWRRV